MRRIKEGLTLDVKMFTYINHKTEQSQTSSNRKRKLFSVDPLDENISPSKVYDLEHDFPETSFSMNPIELSPTLSEKFGSLISNSENEHLSLSSIATEESSSSRPIELNTITPLKSKNVEGVEHLLKESFGSNKIKNNKAGYEVKASCSYDYKKITPKDFDVERVTRSHYNPKVKAKPFKDSKSTSKKRPRSTSRELKTKINLFPDVISPFKKKSMDVKSCKNEERSNSTKKNKTLKQSSSKKKNVWTEYMDQDKPKRILLEQDSNRKFFKSKVIHNETLSQKKDNGFNYKVINWNDENRNGFRVEVKKPNFNSPKKLNDTKIDENGQNINKSIELLANNHMPVIHSPLQALPFKRNHKDLKCMNKDVPNHNSIVKPVLIKNACGLNENCNEEKFLFACSSPAACLKKVSNSSFGFNDTIINEPTNTSIDFNDTIIDEFTAIDASVIVNESSETNLFPIFMNKTPPPNRIVCSSEKKSSVQKKKRIFDSTQYQIYAGQKKFGGFLCKECGLYYSRGEPEDESEHDKYHKAKEIFKYKSSKNEKVIFKDIDERIVVISGYDSKALCSKALEVMLYVNKELGCDTQHSVLPTTKKVHLYIKKRQVIGCLVIDLISQAYRNLETESEDIVVVSEESYPVKAGVNCIWTKWDNRNTGIATKLLDFFRKNYAFGHILALDEIAFTVPTRSGKQFIKKYTNQNDFLVYTGW